MRVVTTASKHGLEEYGWRWLEARKYWPKGTEFVWYSEGYGVPDCQCHDLLAMHDFVEWRKRYAHYVAPSWRFDIVKFACKLFAAFDALRDYDGVGVWCDADCVAFDLIPDGLIEQQVANDYMALYQRTGHYTETGMWIVNCAHPQHKDFMGWMMMLLHAGHFTRLHEWIDCTILDAAVKRFTTKELITVKNLSGEHSKKMHPQAHAEPFCRYLDHCKGARKVKGYSAENQYHHAPAQL